MRTNSGSPSFSLYGSSGRPKAPPAAERRAFFLLGLVLFVSQKFAKVPIPPVLSTELRRDAGRERNLPLDKILIEREREDCCNGEKQMMTHIVDSATSSAHLEREREREFSVSEAVGADQRTVL